MSEKRKRLTRQDLKKYSFLNDLVCRQMLGLLRGETTVNLLKSREKEFKMLWDAVRAIPNQRIQTIIHFRYEKCLSWEDVAREMGDGQTGEAVRKYFERYMKREEAKALSG